MKKLFCIYLLSLFTVSFAQSNGDVSEYTDGVFIVNEDWFGHQNSTVNFLSSSGEWKYRVFQEVNPGQQLGCTSQFGTIYGNRFYIVSKQEKDPGASIVGSRLAVCQAKTMKCLTEIQTFATNDAGNSIADGRSYLGVDEKKGYIGTSNGIWVLNTETMQIEGQIAGTGNPNSSGYGQLYHAQIGTMVRTEDHVFAIHQKDGLKIIDASADTLIKTIAPPLYEKNGNMVQSGFGSIVQSKDGNLWISMAATVTGNGATLPFVLKMDPISFVADTIQIPNAEGVEDIPNSWYAWTVDGFCASTQENKIYWAGNNGNSWFKGRRIFCYDIDKEEFSKVFDFEEMPGEWILYGAGFRIHPVTDELYCSIFHQFQDPTYETIRISKEGELLARYPMITNFWFPAMPVFPDNNDPVLKEIPDIKCELNGSCTIDLNEYISDADNMNVSIVKSIIKNTAPHVFTASISGGKLQIQASEGQAGIVDLKLRFNSNGKLIDTKVKVIVGEGGDEYGDEVSGISLDKEEAEMIIAETLELTATIKPINALNKNVTWSSSNEEIATVDDNGLVTALSAGLVDITVTSEDGGYTAVCKITVKEPTIDVTGISLNQNMAELMIDETLQLKASIAPVNATNQNITWTSDKENIASVSATGLVVAHAEGEAVITVTSEDGSHTASCTIKVKTPFIAVTGISLNQNTAELLLDETLLLTATLAPVNATNQNVTWTSDKENIASVSATGLVVAHAEGEAVITATSEDGSHSASCTVKVKKPFIAVTDVTIDPMNADLYVHETIQLLASISPSNASNQDLIWTSTNTNIATVDASGLVTAKAVGEASITATSVDGNHSASCLVKVSTETGLDSAEDQTMKIYMDAPSETILIESPKSGIATIYDLSGRVVLRAEINGGLNRIACNGLSRAIYIVEFGGKSLKFAIL